VNVELFNYNLPKERIAQYPVVPRDSSRLLVLKTDGSVQNKIFKDILEFIPKGSLLIFNDTKVIPARIFTKKSTGGNVELLLTSGVDNIWRSIYKSSRKPKIGDFLTIIHENNKADLKIEVLNHIGRELELKLPVKKEPWDFLNDYGHIPLPPYIERDDEKSDVEKYQTCYAQKPGAIAAPTAGLHFTPELLEKLKEKGVIIEYLTLHVGIGTFLPVKVDNTDDHIMHEEYFHIPVDLIEKIKNLPEDKKIISVGTTTLRALEGAATGKRKLNPSLEKTKIFITPGYKFNIIDSLITNFHLPKSTLLMLVSAFRTREQILSAYEKAMKENYRFFSYGDAMLIL
jgi:S-adenosylmethionine:tRNA ribosyltransferase-isomerase